MECTIAQRYATLEAEVIRVARAAGRDPASIGVLAVTKAQPVEAIGEAIAAGVRQIGENYVQEARCKFPELPPVGKHFIGRVQTNKATEIARLFDAVQSVDRLAAGEALATAAARLGKRLPVLIQVNVSEFERFGCPPERAAELAERLRRHDNIAVEGVMAIAPVTQDEQALAVAFASAARAFAAVGGTTLSIGMSSDWPAAVRAGSTLIRIGTALFGPRASRPASKTPAKA